MHYRQIVHTISTLSANCTNYSYTIDKSIAQTIPARSAIAQRPDKTCGEPWVKKVSVTRTLIHHET